MESLAETSVVEKQGEFGLASRTYPAELLRPFGESYRRLSSPELNNRTEYYDYFAYPEEIVC